MSDAKVTLTNNNTLGDGSFLSIDVFLPEGAALSIEPYDQPPPIYYQGSRFEHGSMIGNFFYQPPPPSGTASSAETTPEQPTPSQQQPKPQQLHNLFGTELWRIPHNSHWPESGIGLASEFGVGDDGDFCYYRCGWLQQEAITNGVLGYRQAQPGQPFLKIGVGSLIKGSCPSCDSTEDYKFNSPYQFVEQPVWSAVQETERRLRLFHQASLNGGQFGYTLEKIIELLPQNELVITTTLVNTGWEAFATVWYSHNFFHCDQIAVGPGYAVELNLNADQNPLYDEPGTWSWSTPLAQYANIMATVDRTVRIVMNRALAPGIRIKTEFDRDDTSQGAFVLQACGSNILATLESNDGLPLQMYAYNLYLERGTFSPEPQVLLQLPANGGSRSWRQRLTISSLAEHQQEEIASTTPSWTHFFALWTASLTSSLPVSSSSASPVTNHTTAASLAMAFGGFVAVTILILMAVRWKIKEQKRHLYTRIADFKPNGSIENGNNKNENHTNHYQHSSNNKLDNADNNCQHHQLQVERMA